MLRINLHRQINPQILKEKRKLITFTDHDPQYRNRTQYNCRSNFSIIVNVLTFDLLNTYEY